MTGNSENIPPLYLEWENEVYESNRGSALNDAENHIYKAIKANGDHRFAEEAEDHLQIASEHVQQAIRLYQASVALEVMQDGE